jgi:hypothetical protein
MSALCGPSRHLLVAVLSVLENTMTPAHGEACTSGKRERERGGSKIAETGREQSCPQRVLIRPQRGPGLACSAGMGFEGEQYPLPPGLVRGINGPGGYTFVERKGSQACEVCWVVNSDVRGWIPRSLVESAMVSVLLRFHDELSAQLARVAAAAASKSR